MAGAERSVMSEHIATKKSYVTIFGILMALTALTVLVAFVDLGPLNTFMALGIAITKATLVILFFMRVKYSNRLTWMVVASGFVWLFILFVHTLSDYLTRGWLDVPGR
jgi:cytochrome c oxidase subunit 4